MAKDYRKIWEENFGSIPKDENGFSYEIHHIDGNHHNNDITNLKLITINEHFNIHLSQGDFGAAALISRRIGLGPKYMSEIQIGVKRPGIGGAKKGRIPWNKGRKNCFSDKTIENFKNKRKGKRYGPLKISDEQAKEIIRIYHSKPELPLSKLVGTIRKNGKKFTYENAFCDFYSKKYNVCNKQIHNIIIGKRNVI